MNTALVTPVTNGYLVELFDEESNRIDSAIATENTSCDYELGKVIRNLFKVNTPSVEATQTAMQAGKMIPVPFGSEMAVDTIS
jgi:hypothetical protein